MALTDRPLTYPNGHDARPRQPKYLPPDTPTGTTTCYPPEHPLNRELRVQNLDLHGRDEAPVRGALNTWQIPIINPFGPGFLTGALPSPRSARGKFLLVPDAFIGNARHSVNPRQSG